MSTQFSMHAVGAAALLPPRDISVAQWADENVSLTGSGSAERGQWHTRPYQREPMDVLSPSHPCKQVVLMSAAQMLKTSVMVNFLGYIADVDPGPTLVVEPRSEDAKALSKDRVAPLFRHCPALRGKLAAVKSRDVSLPVDGRPSLTGFIFGQPSAVDVNLSGRRMARGVKIYPGGHWKTEA